MNRLTGRTSRTGQTDNYKLILIMEKKKGWIIEAVIIALGLVVLGSNIQSGINNFVNKDRKVTVKGLSEMEVPANKVTWPIVSKLIGNDMQQLYRDINRNNQVITDFLKKNGIRTHVLGKISDGSEEIPKALRQGHIAYFINTKDPGSSAESDGAQLRQTATEYNVTMFTSLDTVKVLLDVLEETTLTISTIDA